MSGFQTTYEELKLEYEDFWVGIRICFQTTYEELKPATGRGMTLTTRLPDYLWGIETAIISIDSCLLHCFQTTYEELKPPVIKVQGLNLDASRLPMRNWNTLELWDWMKAPLWLPDYLWGIETRPVLGCHVFQVGLPDYLWGIETLLRVRTKNIERDASRLPMRNWNLYLLR